MPASTSFRWRLAGDDKAQGALFEEEVERHVGKGEFRGTEFLHVNAHRIVNEVPKASMVPFRWTINAYRGCSHACSYCLEGSTPILMADGSTKPLASLVIGDQIYGTTAVGNYRRFVRTTVLDHWSTIKPAYRITAEDGTELVASGDHRFLTSRGWKFVTGSQHGRARRPHLTLNDTLMGTKAVPEGPKKGTDYRRGYLCGSMRLLGFRFLIKDVRPGMQNVRLLGGLPERLRFFHTVDSAIDRNRDIDGAAVKTTARLKVVAIEPLGMEMPLYDITTGTGNFIANGVISHNCFARPTHEYLGLDSGEDFEKRIVVKINAVERLRAELAPGRWAGGHIAMGTNTDPYQRCEGKYRLTRGIVETLAEAHNPFSILTKSSLIVRDLDVLAEAALTTDVRVNFSIGTLDEEIWRTTEPGTPHPLRRVEALARLNEAGVPCGVLVAPVLPGLSDRPEQLDAVVKACVDAGAQSISPILLHLRSGVKEHYMKSLALSRPDLVAGYEKLYPEAYASKDRRGELAALVRELVDRHRGRSTAPRRLRRVTAPQRPPSKAKRGPSSQTRQLGLGI